MVMVVMVVIMPMVMVLAVSDMIKRVNNMVLVMSVWISVVSKRSKHYIKCDQYVNKVF